MAICANRSHRKTSKGRRPQPNYDGVLVDRSRPALGTAPFSTPDTITLLHGPSQSQRSSQDSDADVFSSSKWNNRDMLSCSSFL